MKHRAASPKASSVSPDVESSRKELRKLLRPRYIVGAHIGSGGAGIVFKVKDIVSGAQRVTKIMSPAARKAKEHDRIESEFRDEATKLANLSHPNLVTVFEQARKKDVPYFIMLFVNGKELQKAVPEWAALEYGGDWLDRLVTVFMQLGSVLDYLHTRRPRLLHLDLKPENVKVASDHRDRPMATLLDFGISRFAEPEHSRPGKIHALGTFRMWPKAYLDSMTHLTEPNRTGFLIDRSKLTIDLDLHLLGRTIGEVLELGKKKDKRDVANWRSTRKAQLLALEEIVARLDIDKPDVPGFTSSDQLTEVLRKLSFPPGRVSQRFDFGFVRIPGSRIHWYGELARKITDWPRFQRLRGVYQLGLTHLVYPGATHTRFEHSLGVFGNTIEVLDHITSPQSDYRFRSSVADEELVATVLLGLLHDIGHYPFAHQFRVAGKFPPHETRSLQALGTPVAREIIARAFNDDVYRKLLSLEQYIVERDDPHYLKTGSETYPAHYRVLRDVISSTIDVDKLDYVSRDALHAGVPYGRIIDHERFLSSLRVWWGEEGPSLVPSDKGRACAEALVFARYLMTSEVYWNHGVRAYAAMLSAAIAELDPTEVEEHLWDTDDRFLAWLAQNKATRWFTPLVAERRPYRRAFVHQMLGGKEEARQADMLLFQRLESAAEESGKGAGKDESRARIREVVANALGLSKSGWRDHEIVLDVPQGMPHVSPVNVLPEGHDEPGRAGPIFDAIGDNFNGFARKARIFIHPRHTIDKSVSKVTCRVRSALLRAFGIS